MRERERERETALRPGSGGSEPDEALSAAVEDGGDGGIGPKQMC
jgi:hypothetical protein